VLAARQNYTEYCSHAVSMFRYILKDAFCMNRTLWFVCLYAYVLFYNKITQCFST